MNMRSTIFTVLLFGLTASPAWAMPGGGGHGGNKSSLGTLHIVNQCDHAVEFSVNGSAQPTLAPLEVRDLAFRIFSGNKLDVTIAGDIVDFPAANDTKTASLQAAKAT